MKNLWTLSRWNWRHFWGLLLILLVVNLFGPRGLLHWLLIHQEGERLLEQKNEIESKIDGLEQELALFKSSDIVRKRMIRQELGYLKDNEWVLEFKKIK